MNRLFAYSNIVALLAATLALGCRAQSPPGSSLPSAPSSEAQLRHPRLWISADELPKLRGWARADNPTWSALEQAATRARTVYDKGKVPAGKVCTDDSGVYTCEGYAELFAFLSLLEPDEAQRRADAGRAVKLLMAVVDEAKKGAKEGESVRDPAFAVSDRSRWSGEAFALTADWVYPWLTAEQKRDVRTVFLLWADELTHASTTSHNHPEPLGVYDDPKLTRDRLNVRFSANNYFTAHMRNMGLMALSFDPQDDPDGKLGAYLGNATGAWLYMVDDLLRTDAKGGLPPDGLEYGPQTFAYVAEFLLALHSAGRDDGKREPQVRFDGNPWWSDLIPAWLHLMSPRTVEHPWMGALSQPGWYGEGQKYWAADPIDLFAPLGIWARDTGDKKRYDAARFIVRNMAPGGAEKFDERIAKNDDFRQSILYFLLFDPSAPPAADPRPSLPKAHFAPGLGRLYARTGWDGDAATFDYGLGWIAIDHQHGDGNGFEFYRHGEWLTKERTGYGPNIACSDYHDTLAVENDKPYHAKDPHDYRTIQWQRGSQWSGDLSDGPGKLLAHSIDDKYVYALGDATALYNSKYEGVGDIERVVRSIVWLPADYVVVYDRAASKKDGRFKRFWLQLPALPTVSGKRATMRTAKGQQLFVTTLLPADAQPHAEPAEPLKENSEPAELDPIVARLRVESRAKDVRFLHILQGADAKAAADPVALVDAGGDFVAAAVHAKTADCKPDAPCAGAVVVVFPRDAGDAAHVEKLALATPAGTRAVLFTGLVPGAEYTAARQSDGRVHITSGGGLHADDGGALWFALP
ncbi:MAG TPA: hypothetical protein VIA18_20970 [Polyangia bacterium]|nr:hypothetical protein [Polyangia bacterium]